MAEVEPISPCDDGAGSSALAGETAICLFAFADRVDALRPPPPDATQERRLDAAWRRDRSRRWSASCRSPIIRAPIAERHLRDIAWLAPRVRRHGELVEWMAQWSPVFPAPFGNALREPG